MVRRPRPIRADEAFIDRAWFAAWLRENFGVAELKAAADVRRDESLWSKFRSGAAFPKAAHLGGLAARLDRMEFVLAGIAVLDELGPVRDLIASRLSEPGTDPRPQRASHLRPDVVERQLLDRLSDVRADLGHVPGETRVLVVASGHGVSSLCRVLITTARGSRVIDLSRSAVEADHHAVLRAQDGAATGATLIVPRDRLALVERAIGERPHTTFEVRSPDWRELVDARLDLGSGSWSERTDELLARSPLRLVDEAIDSYYAHLTHPVVLTLASRTPAPDRVGPPPPAPLSTTQRSILAPVLLPTTRSWGVIVPPVPGLSGAVADHVASHGGSTPLFSPNATAAAVAQLWATLAQRSQADWPVPLRAEPSSAPADFVVDLGIGAGWSADIVLPAIRETLRLVGAKRPQTVWRLCGTLEQIEAVGSALGDSLMTVVVPTWPRGTQVQRETPDTPALALLPATSTLTPDEVADRWIDPNGVLDEMLVLIRNGVLKVHPGQGGTAAATTLMVRRADHDRSLGSAHATAYPDVPSCFVSLDRFVRHDLAEETLIEEGFAVEPRAGTVDPSVVASPFARRARKASPAEWVAAAERVSERLLGVPDQIAGLGPEVTVYLDLSPTRYGRIPTTTRLWNGPESLTAAYERSAARLLELVSTTPHRAMIVVVPPAFHTVDRFPPMDFNQHELPPADAMTYEAVLAVHDLLGSSPEASGVRCSFARALMGEL